MSNDKKFFLTKKGLELLQQQIVEVQNEIQDCIKKMGESAKRDNDLRENPEFLALRTRSEYQLPAKLTELRGILSNYVLVEDMPHIKSNDMGHVSVGCKVTLVDENSLEKVIHILGYGESDPASLVVNYQAPLAKSLLELMEGDEVELALGGKKMIYSIERIQVSEKLL